MTRRSELREATFLILFRADFYEADEIPAQVKAFFEGEDGFTDEEKQYIGEKVISVCEHIPEIDAELDKISIGWKVKRMTKVDLTALRLAFYEIKYEPSVPVSTAINDAVELSKNYGTDNSASFVNGILATVANGSDK